MSRSPRLLVRRRGTLGSYADALAAAATAALRRAGIRAGLGPRHELSLLLCDNAAMRSVNRRWRGKDKPTDVLSFPIHDLAAGAKAPEGPLGDIVIALPTARKAARQIGETAARHVERLAIHGLAHLLGYDHGAGAEARRMEREEERLLGRKWLA